MPKRKCPLLGWVRSLTERATGHGVLHRTLLRLHFLQDRLIGSALKADNPRKNLQVEHGVTVSFDTPTSFEILAIFDHVSSMFIYRGGLSQRLLDIGQVVTGHEIKVIDLHSASLLRSLFNLPKGSDMSEAGGLPIS